jgi:hypothetical protein
MDYSTVVPPKYSYSFSTNNKSLLSGTAKTNMISQNHSEDSTISVFFAHQISKIDRKIVEFIKNPQENYQIMREWAELIIKTVNDNMPQDKIKSVSQSFYDCLSKSKDFFKDVTIDETYWEIFQNNGEFSTISEALDIWCMFANNIDKLHIFSVTLTKYQQTYTLVGYNTGTKLTWMLIDTCCYEPKGDFEYSDVILMTPKELMDWMNTLDVHITHWIPVAYLEYYKRSAKIYKYIKDNLSGKHTYEFVKNNSGTEFTSDRDNFTPKDLVKTICKLENIPFTDELYSYHNRLLPNVNKFGQDKILIVDASGSTINSAKITMRSDFLGKEPIVATKLPNGSVFAIINPAYQ